MKDKYIVVSGGFDFLTPAHCSMILEAGKLGNVIVIANSDEWLIRKKGYNALSFDERKRILLSLKGVVEVVKAKDDDGSVCETLIELHKIGKVDVFGNGGDRLKLNTPEVALCEELGIELIWELGGGTKEFSSSKMIEELVKKINDLKNN